MATKVVFTAGSAGGFLDPPGHPHHRYSVNVYDGGRVKQEPDAMMSVQGAADDESLPEKARARARRLLEDATLIESELWVRNVYGYFRSMFVPEDGDRDVRSLITDSTNSLPAERHAAVAMIRTHFPDHEPRTDLIADTRYCYGSYACVHCGERVQYDASIDALSVFDRHDATCADGRAHAWPERDV